MLLTILIMGLSTFVVGLLPSYASIGVAAPIILIVCAIGAYTVEASQFDIWLMLVFGLVGYVFKKLDYPLAPLVLALVLGDRAEDAFRQALLGSGGDLRVFFSNGLVSTLMILGLALLLWGPIGDAVKRLRRRRTALPAAGEV